MRGARRPVESMNSYNPKRDAADERSRSLSRRARQSCRDAGAEPGRPLAGGGRPGAKRNGAVGETSLSRRPVRARGTPLVVWPRVRTRRPLSPGFLSLFLPFFLPFACGDTQATRKGERHDGGGASGEGDGGAPRACGSSPGSTFDCIDGCLTGHVLSARVCQDGAWVCPIGTFDHTVCGGTRDCPFSEGGACTDGATGVIYYKQCQNGQWSCPGGTHPLTSPAVEASVPDAVANPDGAVSSADGGTCGDSEVACPFDAGPD